MYINASHHMINNKKMKREREMLEIYILYIYEGKNTLKKSYYVNRSSLVY